MLHDQRSTARSHTFSKTTASSSQFPDLLDEANSSFNGWTLDVDGVSRERVPSFGLAQVDDKVDASTSESVQRER